MLSELAFPHIRCCLSAIPSDLMKSTAVDESLSSMNKQFCSRENQLLQKDIILFWVASFGIPCICLQLLLCFNLCLAIIGILILGISSFLCLFNYFGRVPMVSIAFMSIVYFISLSLSSVNHCNLISEYPVGFYTLVIPAMLIGHLPM